MLNVSMLWNVLSLSAYFVSQCFRSAIPSTFVSFGNLSINFLFPLFLLCAQYVQKGYVISCVYIYIYIYIYAYLYIHMCCKVSTIWCLPDLKKSWEK